MIEMTAFSLCVRLVAPGLRLGPSPRGGGRPLSSGSAWTANHSSHSPRVVGWTPPALEGCALSSCGPAGRGASVAIHPAPSTVALPRLTPRFAGCVQLSAGGRSLSLAFGSTWTVDPEAGGQPWTASRLTALCHRAMPPWGASPGAPFRGWTPLHAAPLALPFAWGQKAVTPVAGASGWGRPSPPQVLPGCRRSKPNRKPSAWARLFSSRPVGRARSPYSAAGAAAQVRPG